jgi:hypothetical protein
MSGLLSSDSDDNAERVAELERAHAERDEAIAWAKELEGKREEMARELAAIQKILSGIFRHPGIPEGRAIELLEPKTRKLVGEFSGNYEAFADYYPSIDAYLSVRSKVHYETAAAVDAILTTFARSPNLTQVLMPQIVDEAIVAVRGDQQLAEFEMHVEVVAEFALRADSSWLRLAFSQVIHYALARTKTQPRRLRMGARIFPTGCVAYVSDSDNSPQIEDKKRGSGSRHTYSPQFASFCRIIASHNGGVWKQAEESDRGSIFFRIPQ